MAGKRSIPTDLFWDETFSALCGETQSIFIGLILGADDHGRGPAGATVLSRMLAKDPSVIQTALQDLDTSRFIQCYQVEGKYYYHITHWNEWETLNKPARSRYPAPPDSEGSVQTDVPQVSEKSPENPGNPQVFSETPEITGKSSPEAEAEEKRREEEAEGPETPRTLIPFPSRADGGKVKTGEVVISELAKILHLPVTSALSRLVAEFQHVPARSLLGEANAARAWVDEQHGKRKKSTQMTLPFFRRWLQRSQTIQEQYHLSSASSGANQATGTIGPSGSPRLPDLMHLDDDRRKGVACP